MVIIQTSYIVVSLHSVECAGVYDRKYEQFYNDGSSGCTTVKKLWEMHREATNDPDGTTVNCSCCEEYRIWKESHPTDFQKLKEISDNPSFYKAFPSKKVTVVEDGSNVVYTGTIHAVACTGKAVSGGSHPYQCNACFQLVHGKSSQLLRKYNRSKKLKNPRNDAYRAARSGVTHKFCSPGDIENALKFKTVKAKIEKEKVNRLNCKIEKMLNDDWYQNCSTVPFLKSLHSLIANKQLSEFDLSFLTNWTGKKANGQYYRADIQARALAVLYCNKLGERNYNELSPLLGLPCLRQVQKIKRKLLEGEIYLPGINEWVLQKLCERDKRPIQNSMDGTRIIRTIELYDNKYLVGEEFPADV